MIAVGGVGEIAVVRDGRTLDVAVPVATSENAEFAVSGGGGCRSLMPTTQDTLFFPSLFTLTLGKTSLIRCEIRHIKTEPRKMILHH